MTPDQYNREKEMERRANMSGIELAAEQAPVLCLLHERRIDPEGSTARFLDITAGRVLGSNELERIATILFGEKMTDQKPYPELLSADESRALLDTAETLWADLQADNMGGFSGINRPFWIMNKFRDVIEEFGHRDIGQTWSMKDLVEHPDKPR